MSSDKIKLEPDEEICEECNGTGERGQTRGGFEGEPEYEVEGECTFCNGTGKVKIIEDIKTNDQ